jgi:cyclophilin family peptidyl-prolyl cis-trans isomerase
MTIRTFLFSALLACMPVFTNADTGNVFVLTRLQSEQVINRGSQAVIDLTDHFQTYPAPGPVASFIFSKPVATGIRQLYVKYETDGDGAQVRDANNRLIPVDTGDQFPFQTFQTSSGAVYTNLFAAYPEDFVRQQFSVRFQTYPQDAQQTVANFMTYVRQGDYHRTIIHRDLYPGAYAGGGAFTKINIIQTGGYRIYSGAEEGFVLEYVPAMPAITLEAKRSNIAGTLSMARGGTYTATSQFFINLSNNSSLFDASGTTPGYAVFAELSEGSLDDLIALADVPVYNLIHTFGNDAFANVPMYSPFWDDPLSYLTFDSITVSSGDPTGVTYAVEAVDRSHLHLEDNPDSFTWTIAADGRLIVRAVNTGTLLVNITGSDGQARSRSFQTQLLGANQEILDAFPVRPSVSSGSRYTSQWFGSFTETGAPFPSISHDEHGRIYLHGARPSEPVRFTAIIPPGTTPVPVLAGSQYLFHDPVLGWLLTSSGQHPWFYSFRHARWFHHLAGKGTSEGRWFFDPLDKQTAGAGWFIDQTRYPVAE